MISAQIQKFLSRKFSFGVFAPPRREGRPLDPIADAATGHNIPTFEFKRLRDQEAVDQFKSLGAMPICSSSPR